MLTVGRLCVKTAGRDAMEYCVIVEEIDKTYVLIDGNVRRKKVNKAHLEPLKKTINIKKGADTKSILEEFEKAGIEVKKSSESKSRTPKPQVKKDRTKKKNEENIKNKKAKEKVTKKKDSEKDKK